MKRGLLSCLIVTLAGATGLAGDRAPLTDTSTVQLADSIVVVADRFGRPAAEVIWPVTVVRRGELRSAASLAAVSDGLGGADIRQTSGLGSVATLSSWGSFNRHLLLLYDGRPVRDYSLGGFNLSDFSPQELERVELLKGPHSALYGTDAMGGVLNLIPRSTLLDRLEYRGTVGSLGLQQHYAWLSNRSRFAGYGISAEYGEADNRRPNSGSQHLMLNARSDMVSDDGSRSLRLAGRYYDDSLGAPGPVPDPNEIPTFGDRQSSSLIDHQLDRSYSFDIGLRQVLGKRGEAGLDLFWEKKNLEFHSTYDFFGEVNTLSRYHKRSSGISARIRNGSEKLNMSGGVDWLSGSLMAIGEESSPGVYSSRSVWVGRQNQFDVWSSLTALPGGTVSLETTGRVGLIRNRTAQPALTTGFLISPAMPVQFRFSYGYAFRHASIADQFADDVYTAGRVNLDPETSNTFSAGVQLEGADLVRNVSLTLFSQKVRDLIQYYYDPTIFRSVPRNVETYSSQGLDWGVALELPPGVDLSISGVWQDATQSVTERQQHVRAFYTPKLKMQFSAGWTAAKNLEVSGSLGHTSARETRLFDGATKRLAGVWELAGSLAVRLHPRLELALSGSDLTDQRRPDQFGFTATDHDYPSPGRQVRLSLSTEIQ